jgi:hypothetical protein
MRLESIIEKCRDKPRRHARLKNLPENFRAEVYGYACMHGLVKTANWLKARGIKTSRSRVSEFLRWWQSQQELKRIEQDTFSILKRLKEESPNLTEPELDRIGQTLFSFLLIKSENSKAWLKLYTAAMQR